MLRSLNAGVTGLMNHQTRMDVIGNNISNVNTVGFKGSRVTFEESFNQLIKGASRTESKAGGTNPMQVGLGVSVGSIDTIVGQGNLQNTGRIFDLAVQGNAFFGVSDGNGTYYTRNGAFQLDSQGYIILPTNGMVLQGRMADTLGNFPPGTAIGNLQIPMSQQAPAKETTEVNIGRNLNSEADAKGSVTYSQRMLHQADKARVAGTNSENDPGREATTLTSLYNSRGQSLNVKDGDVLTISWYDQASVTGGTLPTGELSIRVSELDGDDPDKNTAWTIEGFAAAIQKAINTDKNGNELYSYDGVNYFKAQHTVDVNPDGSFSINYAYAAAGVATLPANSAVSAEQIFNLQIKSSNPLSDSYVNKAFHFGSHIGPEIGNYPENTDANKVKSDVLLRPAEQFDYIYELRDSSGRPLYPGLDVGDPIDVFGSVGKTSIENGKSDALAFYPTNAYDMTDPFKPQRIQITDPTVIGQINDYKQWQTDVNLWAAKNPIPAGYANFAAKQAAYLSNAVPTPTIPASIAGLTTLVTNGLPGTYADAGITYSLDVEGNISRIDVYPAFTGTSEKATLLDDLLAKIRNDFKLPAEYIDRDSKHIMSVSMNPSGTDDGIPPGSIVIRGSKGSDFSINNLTVSAKNSNADQILPTNFNAVMGFTEKRKAENVGVVDTPISVYDESGAEHILTMTFVHTGRAGEWEWKASFAGKENIIAGGTGKVTFGQDGTVSSWLFDEGGSQLEVDPCNGSNIMRLNLNVGGPGDFKGLTQFAAASTVSCIGQDGYPTGNLIEVTIDEYGLIEGTFSNGTNRKIAQIMMIDFANPGGLMNMTDSIFTTSANSGDPIWGLPVTQSSSKLKPGALEMSNVDLAGEFTNMITTQRGYQANSRVITVSDTMLEELVNLKR